MQLSDLKIVIENLSGSYKKFTDDTTKYPLLGVTYPTHYGYIVGYTGEDGDPLDVFIGNGEIFGSMRVKRDDTPNGIETKFLLGVNQAEVKEVTNQFGPVIDRLETFSKDEFLAAIADYKS